MKKKKKERKKKNLKIEKQVHGIWFHHLMTNRMVKGVSTDTSSSWAIKSLQMLTATMKLEDKCLLAGKLKQN